LDNRSSSLPEGYRLDLCGKAEGLTVSPNCKITILQGFFGKKTRAYHFEETAAGTPEYPLGQGEFLSAIRTLVFHGRIIWRREEAVKSIFDGFVKSPSAALRFIFVVARGHPLKGPCQEEKPILCEKIHFLA
jgi:hypothetical protein